MNSKKNKNEWEIKKLGDILDIERGGSPRPINSFLTNDEDGINWIKIGDTKNVNKYIESTRQKIKPEGLKKSRLVEEGDFILSNSMSFGKPYIMKTTGAIHDGWLVLRPKSNNIDQDFLYLILSSPLVFKQFDNLAAGSTVRNLNIGLVKSVQIPLPPLSEQKRIVKILDEVFGKIETAKKNVEKNLQNSKELFESYLQSLKGEKSTMGTLVDIKTGKLNANAMKENSQYPFFTCAKEIYSIDSYSFDCEAILLAGNNAVGDFNVKYYNGKFDAYQRTYVITVNKENKVLYRYLYYQLLKSLKEFKMKSVGAGTKFLKLGMIQDLKIILPPLTEQKSIVKKLDALSKQTKKLEKNYQQKIDDLDELKKSVLQKAFNGEL